MNFYVDIPPIEHRNPAKTKHVILKRPQASWSSSVYSVPLGNKIIPNRDYPYEGLSMLVGLENWHVLDGIATGVKINGKYVSLHPKSVSASPWRVIYKYENAGVKLNVGYYLLDVKSEGIATSVILDASAGKDKEISLAVEPIADIRHMYHDSSPDEHWSSSTDGGLMLGRGPVSVMMGTNSKNFTAKTWLRSLNWHYKMGSGYRRRNETGEAVFIGEDKIPVSLGEIEIPSNSAMITVSCAQSEREVKKLNELAMKEGRENERAEEGHAGRIVKALGAKDETAFRTIAMTKFGMYVDKHFFHEAGDFWFRTPWMRDEFEGLLHNIETLIRIGKGNEIKKVILSAFNFQNEDGIIPNRVPGDYNSADATLLAYILADEYVRRTGDSRLAEKISKNARKTFKGFKKNSLDTINGPPVLHENGLISVVPWHSWTDGMRIVDGHKVPIRIPEDWERELILSGKQHELNKPVYLLPEINAQWILTLRSWAAIEGPKDNYSKTLSKAIESFKRIFANDRLLYNAVTLEGRKDSTLGSPAVVAISLLADLFSDDELRTFVDTIKENLLVKRDGQSFGILVRQSDKNVYYGDSEYHEAVVWPRDTPYLIRLLERAGEKETIKELLESALEHQMNEGAVFYNGELFSCDGGDLVPVKNPVQWWSQWNDPYILDTD
ncbi:hypothetical protein KKA03_01575 [archaeon]|nr:hypothetical protein [archaeon]